MRPSLDAIEDGDAKTAGITVGQAAAALIAARDGDGYAAASDFVMPAPGPGVWQIPADQVWAWSLRSVGRGAVGRQAVEVTHELGQVGMPQDLADGEDLAGVEPVVVGHAQ